MKNLILIITFLTSINIFSQQKPNYPEPEKGMKRVDFKLPKIDNYKEYKVEIRFGQKVNVSECDDIKDFSFNIENLKKYYGIPPYRFPYYVLPNDITTELVTLKNGDRKCDDTKKIKKKVLSSQNLFDEYNYHFPIPFYIPENWTLEYRLWKIDSEYKNAEE